MCRKASKGFRQGLSPVLKWFLNPGDQECGKGMLLAHQGPEMSQIEIGGDKRISRHLSGSVPVEAQIQTVIAVSRIPLWLP